MKIIKSTVIKVHTLKWYYQNGLRSTFRFMSKEKKRRYTDGENNVNNEIYTKIGERMKEIRIAKGYKNYEKFAYDNNIPRAQYGRYERGSDLKLSSLMKVLDGFDMSLEEFFSKL